MSVRAFEGVFPALGEGAWVDPTAVVIGDVLLGRNVSVWPGVVIRGDVNRIEIGEDTNIQDGSVLHVTHRSTENPEGFPLRVGRGVTVGHKVVLHGCTIGDGCLIGIGAIVMDGAILEDRVMLGAGSLVPPGKRLSSGSLYVGSPARAVRRLGEDELAALVRSSEGYIRLKERSRSV